MGYTHFFPHTKVTDEVWNKIKEDVSTLFLNLPDDIKLSDDKNHPDGNLITKPEQLFDEPFARVWFNGTNGNAHETFCLKRDGSNGFEFCKTRLKPYDLMVCACLIVYSHHSPDTIELGSDGDKDDWRPALDFVERVLGAQYVMKFIMEKGERLWT